MINKFKIGDFVQVISGMFECEQGFVEQVHSLPFGNWFYSVELKRGLTSIDEDHLQLVEVRCREERMKKLEELMSELTDVTVLYTNPYKHHITNVIFNNPATIVFWSDGSKTIVKAAEGEAFDEEKGLAMAISKKVLGNKGNYYNEFKKWLPEGDEK